MRANRIKRCRLQSGVPDPMAVSAQEVAFLGLAQESLERATELTQRE